MLYTVSSSMNILYEVSILRPQTNIEVRKWATKILRHFCNFHDYVYYMTSDRNQHIFELVQDSHLTNVSGAIILLD